MALAAPLLLAPAAAQAQSAAALRERHVALRPRLSENPFQRPLVLESALHDNDTSGDVYAVVAQPFASVQAALDQPGEWCELLMLHQNVKGCSVEAGTAPRVHLSVGRKFDQPAGDAHQITFAFTVPARTPDYLRAQMSADEGPLGTHRYRLSFEAVPLEAGSSFVHMSYAYAYGTAARLAMQAYLATAGRDKVGFSTTGAGGDGAPAYVGGLRGVTERNTMRYYLAIEAYLAGLAVPPGERRERRLRGWYDATEKFARQLHEMPRDDYLAMKRREFGASGAP